MQFQLFDLIPLPIQVNQTTIYSYISPSYPYLLMSTTRSHYGQLKTLEKCRRIPPATYICMEVVIHLTKERPICETELKIRPNARISSMNTLPPSCETRTIKSEFEVWHAINPNQWLYVLSKPVTGTITCEHKNDKILDVELQGVGIFTLKPQCRCYTLSTLLQSESNQSSNFTQFIPPINIVTDDCCIRQQDFLQEEEMHTLQIHDLNLNELRHAQSKLQQFDEILQQNLNKPFIVQHSQWYNVLLGVLAIIALFIVLYCCCVRCCHCHPFSFFRRLFCRRSCKALICINSHNTITQKDVQMKSYKNLQEIEAQLDEHRRSIHEATASYQNPSPQSRRSIERTFKL